MSIHIFSAVLFGCIAGLCFDFLGSTSAVSSACLRYGKAFGGPCLQLPSLPGPLHVPDSFCARLFLPCATAGGNHGLSMPVPASMLHSSMVCWTCPSTCLGGVFEQSDAACLTRNVVVLEAGLLWNHVWKRAIEHMVDQSSFGSALSLASFHTEASGKCAFSLLGRLGCPGVCCASSSVPCIADIACHCPC